MTTDPVKLALDFDEVRDVTAVAVAGHEIRPEVKLQPKYSTNTGVPGTLPANPEPGPLPATPEPGQSPATPEPGQSPAGPELLAAVDALRRADPVLRDVIDRVGIEGLGDARGGRPDDHYGSLVRSIVGQQLSTKAARAIYTRLTERYGGRTPTPEEVLADDPDELRAAAGLSRAKVIFLRSLAEHVVNGSLDLQRLDRLPDEEVMAELVAVKGIGPWSAHIFLMFHLQRPDVLPVGDLGIRRAVMINYALDALPDAATTERIAEPWRPHRTLASRFLWRSLSATPV